MSRTLVDPVEVAAQLAVMRALSTAGRRARLPRHLMTRAKECHPQRVHVEIRLAYSEPQCDRLLAEMWDDLAAVITEHDLAGEPCRSRMLGALDQWTRRLIVGQIPPDWGEMRRVLDGAC